MAKQGEIDYLQNAGEEHRIGALNKPFSEPKRWQYLMDMGAILRLLPEPPANLLDLGAGSGWTSVFFARSGYQVTSQDIAPDMTECAKQNAFSYSVSNIDFCTADYEELNFHEEFDCAIFYDALHHAVNEEAALKRAWKALRPNGICLLVEPGEGHSKQSHTLEAVRKFGVTEKDAPPWKIISLAKQVGFREFKVYRRQSHPIELEWKEILKSCYSILMHLLTGKHLKRCNIVWLRK